MPPHWASRHRRTCHLSTGWWSEWLLAVNACAEKTANSMHNNSDDTVVASLLYRNAKQTNQKHFHSDALSKLPMLMPSFVPSTSSSDTTWRAIKSGLVTLVWLNFAASSFEVDVSKSKCVVHTYAPSKPLQSSLSKAKWPMTHDSYCLIGVTPSLRTRSPTSPPSRSSFLWPQFTTLEHGLMFALTWKFFGYKYIDKMLHMNTKIWMHAIDQDKNQYS